MSEVAVREVKARFAEFLNRVCYGHERIVVVSRGRRKAALVSLEDLARLENLDRSQAGEGGSKVGCRSDQV